MPDLTQQNIFLITWGLAIHTLCRQSTLYKAISSTKNRSCVSPHGLDTCTCWASFRSFKALQINLHSHVDYRILDIFNITIDFQLYPCELS